jgi:hypothetical protein
MSRRNQRGRGHYTPQELPISAILGRRGRQPVYHDEPGDSRTPATPPRRSSHAQEDGEAAQAAPGR